MDTERETEASVLGANALWERWACHEQLPAWWIRKQVLLQHFPLSQTLSLSLSLSLSLWPLEWFATSLLIDNHVGEKPSEAYYRTLRCLRWHFLAGVMTRWHYWETLQGRQWERAAEGKIAEMVGPSIFPSLTQWRGNVWKISCGEVYRLAISKGPF